MTAKTCAGLLGVTMALLATPLAGWAGEITIIAREFEFTPNEITVTAGEQITVTLRNEGVLSHNLGIPDLQVQTDTVQSGDTGTMTFTAPKTGTFQFDCLVPGHVEAGMHGSMLVRAKEGWGQSQVPE